MTGSCSRRLSLGVESVDSVEFVDLVEFVELVEFLYSLSK